MNNKDNNIFVTEFDFQKSRNEIRRGKKEGKNIIFSGDDELNRKVLEKEDINVLLLKLSNRKDKLKQRNSGFNQVLAKLAQKKHITIGINLDEILNADKKEKAKILARLRQNIELCKKNKIKMIFISQNHKNYQKDSRDLKSLGSVIGMPTWMTKGL